MYPSPADPAYGGFIARCAASLRDAGIEVDTVVMGRSARVMRRLAAYTRFAWHANRSLLGKGYDCVWLHQPLHSLLASLPALWWCGAPLVLNFHGHDLLPVTRRGHLLRWLVRGQFTRAHRVLVPSARFKQLFDTEFGASATAFPSGGIAPPHLAAAPPLAQRPRSVLWLSRWVEGKGWPAFLAIAARMADADDGFSFTLAGGGADAERIRSLLRQRGLSDRVRLVVSQDAERNAALMRSHRYFVLPSDFDESLALVNLEAMACGCVVLSRDFAAAREYLEHGVSGYRFGAATFVDDCVTTLRQLESDGPRAQAIADAARAAALPYSEPSVMARLPALLGLRSSA